MFIFFMWSQKQMILIQEKNFFLYLDCTKFIYELGENCCLYDVELLCPRTSVCCVPLSLLWLLGTLRWVTSTTACPHSPAQCLETHAYGFLNSLRPLHIWSPAMWSRPRVPFHLVQSLSLSEVLSIFHYMCCSFLVKLIPKGLGKEGQNR